MRFSHPTYFLTIILQIVLLAFGAVSSAAQETLTVMDRGTRIALPLGDLSFADSVVSFNVGTPAAEPKYSNPEAILGFPDGKDTNALTLGCGGSVVISFDDNFLVDAEGPDLYVFEVGDDVEATKVLISETGQTWHDLGRISGSTSAIDIADFMPDTDIRFRFVKLIDARARCDSRWPGADIDAVAATSAIARTAAADVEPETESGASQPVQEPNAELVPDAADRPDETKEVKEFPFLSACSDTSTTKAVSACLTAVKENHVEGPREIVSVYFSKIDGHLEYFNSRRLGVPTCASITKDLRKLLTYTEEEYDFKFGISAPFCAETLEILEPFGFFDPSPPVCRRLQTPKDVTACVLVLLESKRAPIFEKALRDDQRRCRHPSVQSLESLRGFLENVARFRMSSAQETALSRHLYEMMTCEILDEVLLAAGMITQAELEEKKAQEIANAPLLTKDEMTNAMRVWYQENTCSREAKAASALKSGDGFAIMGLTALSSVQVTRGGCLVTAQSLGMSYEFGIEPISAMSCDGSKENYTCTFMFQVSCEAFGDISEARKLFECAVMTRDKRRVAARVEESGGAWRIVSLRAQ